MRGMRFPVLLLALAATLPTAAPQARPAGPPAVVPCRDHTVDEYLAEMHKRKRNKNPLPSDTCFFGWCHETGAGGPDTQDLPVPQPPEAPPQTPTRAQPGQSSSASTAAAATAGLQGTTLAKYDPLAGARNTDVGDSYFDEKSYPAALSRYREALADKPDDPGIHLRLGRTYEKLDEVAKAYEHYDAALILAPAGPTARAAQAGLDRLRPRLAAAGADAAALHARNAAAIAVTCPAGKP